MVYFAQHHLNTDALAMITASHNDNGWTGIKCGIEKSLTFGPDEMKEIKKLALAAAERSPLINSEISEISVDPLLR